MWATLAIASIAAATGIVSLVQNHLLNRKARAIQVNVDGNLTATRDEGAALRREVEALKNLVSAVTADGHGATGADVEAARVDAGVAAELSAAHDPRSPDAAS